MIATFACRATHLLWLGQKPPEIPSTIHQTALRKLTEDELVKILTEPKNALVKQYAKQLALNNVKLNITRDALRAMAHIAVERGTGARALRSILEKLMLDVMFEVPSRGDIEEVTINRQAAEGSKPPTLRRRKAKDKEDAA